MNDHSANGNQSEQDGVKLESKKASENNSSSSSRPATRQLSAPRFDRAVILRQSPLWTKAIAATIISVTVVGVTWAALATIEQVVSATGQLQPTGKVKEIQVPVNGVVQKVYVEDGDRVKKDQLLLTLDSTAAKAQLKSLSQVRQSLLLETKFYRTLMDNSSSLSLQDQLNRFKLNPRVVNLARNRIALVAENQLFQAELTTNSGNLDAQQIMRWKAARAELTSRISAARLEIKQLEEQLARTKVQLADAQSRMETEEEILTQLEPLVAEGGIARLQYVRQKQQVQTQKAEVEQLIKEEQRLLFDIAQSKQELANTIALTNKDLFDKIGENQKRIAEIDSQLTKILVENEKQIAEIDSQISQTQLTLKYQEVRAPVAGVVFDLKAGTGFVPAPAQAETLLKIVPGDDLVAELFVPNKDIGFVREGMKVDVRIDSFPFSEFGDIRGKVEYIGSDALPPDEVHQFYRFPVRVELAKQHLDVNDRQINLQPGMSISANIKIREKRTVLSLFTDLFTRKVEVLKEVR